MGTVGVYKLPDMNEPMPDWFSLAACAGSDADVFFPVSYDFMSTAQAKSICDTCPIKWSCRRWALETHQRYGVWGGTTPSERVLIRRKQLRRG